jgi:16S rRNA (guanine966-N2)-methyltransferase
MRIISGKYKGKPITFVKSTITRPLKDSVKENIFNIISHSNLFDIEIKNANILDAYSGVGSFGLECVSRGSGKITFIERDRKAIGILKENIIALSALNSTNVVTEDITEFINKKIITKFKIIFLDPPFIDDSFHNVLKLIYEKKIYQKNHMIIIHRENKLKEKFDDYFRPMVVKKYGRSKIVFGKFQF